MEGMPHKKTAQTILARKAWKLKAWELAVAKRGHALSAWALGGAASAPELPGLAAIRMRNVFHASSFMCTILQNLSCLFLPAVMIHRTISLSLSISLCLSVSLCLSLSLSICLSIYLSLSIYIYIYVYIYIYLSVCLSIYLFTLASRLSASPAPTVLLVRGNLFTAKAMSPSAREG